jgi:hypothetical protein
MLILALSLLGAILTVSALPAARGGVPADAVAPSNAPNGAVQVLWQQARWTTVGGPDELGNSGNSVFVISGEIRNAAERPIRSVKLVYELLDDLHARVAFELGYNRAAEDLRRGDRESGEAHRGGIDVQPIAPGQVDLFRMVFFRSEVPPFAHWRVRVSAVEFADGADSP